MSFWRQGVEGESFGGVDDFGALDVEVGDLFGGERAGEGFGGERRWPSFGREVGADGEHLLGNFRGRLSSYRGAQPFIAADPLPSCQLTPFCL